MANADARAVLNGANKPSWLPKMTRIRQQQQVSQQRKAEWIQYEAAVLQALTAFYPPEFAQAIWAAPARGLKAATDRPPADQVARTIRQETLLNAGYDEAALLDGWAKHRIFTRWQFEAAEEAARLAPHAGMDPEQITARCQPDTMEQTLAWLFYLNHWAKAREALFYADRQGLYRVKARLIEEGYRQGLIQAVTYLPGDSVFDPFKAIWVEPAIEWLFEACDDMAWDEVRARAAQRRLEQATGQPFAEMALGQVEDRLIGYLNAELANLARAALETGRPIEPRRLEALFITVDAVPSICCDQDGQLRWRDVSAWDDLEPADLIALDPEGYSLIGFAYQSPTARFFFHLPYRVAAGFVPPTALAALQASPTSPRSREIGEFIGRAITAEESEQHPILDLLRQLGVRVDLVCPKGLVDKQAELDQRGMRRWVWDNSETDGADEDEFEPDFEDEYG